MTKARALAGVPEPVLETWVIYERPLDYPRHFVLRRHVSMSDGQVIPDAAPTAVTKSLAQARMHVPHGRFNLGRFADDDPRIREVWI